MKEHKHENPRNSRITIKYTGKEPKVYFGFPNKNKGRTPAISVFVYIAQIWALVFFVFLIFDMVSGFGISDLPFPTYEYYQSTYTGIINAIYFYSFVLIIPLTFLLTKKKWYKDYPDRMALKHKKLASIKIFKPKDVKNVNGEYICSIPLFRNIFLDFKAKKDFSKQLDVMNIKEYKFKKRNRKRFINEYFWYAEFKFKSKPKDGQLRVEFY